MRDYMIQQIGLLDTIDVTLDDMLQVAKYQPIQITDSTEVDVLKLQGQELLESIHRKMRMLGLL